jgi:hypothetical protein
MALFPEDKRAAYSGLIVGAIALFIVVFSIVKITNGAYADHGAEGGAAEAPSAAPAATPASPPATPATTPATTPPPTPPPSTR